MDAADDGDGGVCLAHGRHAVSFVRADDDGQRLAGGNAFCLWRRPGLETVAADCITDADICQPVVAVCLGAGQWGRGKHCHGLFPVSFGDDAGWTDLV